MFYAVEYVHSDKNFVDSDGFREVFLYRFNTVKYRDYFVNEFPHIRDSYLGMPHNGACKFCAMRTDAAVGE